MAVRISSTPPNPSIHRKTPEIKKARIINTTPLINRKPPSPFPIFFTFTPGFSSLTQVLLIKQNPIPFSEMGFKFIPGPYTHPMG
jgi:hypothetical protein